MKQECLFPKGILHRRDIRFCIPTALTSILIEFRSRTNTVTVGVVKLPACKDILVLVGNWTCQFATIRCVEI